MGYQPSGIMLFDTKKTPRIRRIDQEKKKRRKNLRIVLVAAHRGTDWINANIAGEYTENQIIHLCYMLMTQ